MKIKIALLLILALPIFLYACNTQDCNNLPSNFATYKEAFEQIENSSFKIEESVNTSKSSWIRGASYYSCDGEKGYLLIETDTKTYIHKDVPLNVWNGFKEADSFGGYYNKSIRGHSHIKIIKST